MTKKYIDADKFWNRLISVSENDWVGFDTIDEVLSGMPAEPRWRPIKDGLPEEEGRYLVSCDSCFAIEIARSYINDEGDRWFCCDWNDPENIVAWMPLPKPYKGGDEK